MRPPWITAALDLLERVLATYLEAFLGLLLVSGPIDLSTAQAAAIATIPAALAVLSTSISAMAVPTGLPWVADTAVRAAKTAVQTFVGYLLAAPMFSLDRSLWTAAAAAVVPATLAVVKAALATRVASAVGPASLVPAAAA